MKRFEIDIGQIISNEEADEKISQERQKLEKEVHFNKVLKILKNLKFFKFKFFLFFRRLMLKA